MTGLVCGYCSESMTVEEAEQNDWRAECSRCRSNMHVLYNYQNESVRKQVKLALQSFALNSSSMFFNLSSVLPVLEGTLVEVKALLEKAQYRLPGSTPLRRSRLYSGLYLKCEHENPTGSFKDTGTLSELSKAYELFTRNSASLKPSETFPSTRGEKAFQLHLASTGNMAISAAYYSHALNIPLVLHCGNHIDPEKMQKMMEFGLDDQVVTRCEVCAQNSDGGYEFQQAHVKVLFEKAKRGSTTWVGDTTLRTEGCKTIGYEIFSQLGNTVPDNVIVPVGNGTLLCAVWKAFDELQQLGFSSRMPRMHGVVVPERMFGIVGAVGVQRPTDLTTAFKIIRDSCGSLITVDEESLESAARSLEFSEKGIRAERAGAMSYAAYLKNGLGSTFKDEITVAVITGLRPELRCGT